MTSGVSSSTTNMSETTIEEAFNASLTIGITSTYNTPETQYGSGSVETSY